MLALGANGYLKLLPYIQEVIKEYFPEAEVFISTWYFDKFIDGEWDAFYPHLSDGTVKGVKKIMSFFHSGKLPNPIEKYGFPEGYDFIDFPEISMHLCAPWGGFGANPLPGFMNQAASNAGKYYRGGFPYSEGIWEDINKYMCLYRYTGMSDDANDAVNAYVRYYFNLEGAQNEELSDAIKKTEVGLARKIVKNNLSTAGAPENIPSASDLCQQCLKELYSMYYCDELSSQNVTPPVGV